MLNNGTDLTLKNRARACRSIPEKHSPPIPQLQVTPFERNLKMAHPGPSLMQQYFPCDLGPTTITLGEVVLPHEDFASLLRLLGSVGRKLG